MGLIVVRMRSRLHTLGLCAYETIDFVLLGTVLAVVFLEDVVSP
jgi:hypothetical protein